MDGTLLNKLTSRACVALLLLVVGASETAAQTIRLNGDRLSGVVLPIEPVNGEIKLSATRASMWDVDDTRRLHLVGDVRIRVAQFSFEADEAVVWINRLPSAEGVINQIAIYSDEMLNPGRRAGLGVTGDQLLVTGSTRGEVTLDLVLVKKQRPTDKAVVRRGEERLARHLQRIAGGAPTLTQYPQVDAAETRLEEPLVPGGTPRTPQPDLPTTVDLPPVDAATIPLVIPTGSVSLSAGKLEIQSGEVENIVYASDSLVVEYTDDRGDSGFSRLTLSAQRGVVFTKPGPLSELPTLAVDADFIIGIYLEGNVLATDGNYTVRGTRVYYDFQNQRAIMLDGVVRTYTRQFNRPIYARAKEFRQIAANQWQAEKATVSTSEFFTPHLAIGASQLTITDQPGGDTTASDTHIQADGNTIRLGGVPVMWWPHLSGRIDNIPIRGVSMSVEDNKGLIVETRWDLFALLGQEAPEGLDLEWRFDGFTERGIGTGLEFTYDFRDLSGVVELYGQSDSGVDKTSSGREIASDHDFRGVALFEHQMRLNTNLILQAQVSHISDERYITTWREDDFEERREYETSLFLRNVDAHTAWTALLKYDLNGFISNSSLLASRTYTVEKLPEFTYRRYGDSIFGDRFTYSSEYRAARIRFSFEDNSPEELGIRARGFGIPRDTEFDDVLRARGLREMFVNRFDTRHELSLPLKTGPLKVVPFVVGRLTAYDDDFGEFSSDMDSSRFFGALGVRLSTSFQRVHNDVESRLFDLHRLRHIIEPSIMLWYGYSNVDQSELPVYDEEVESIADAAAVRFAVRNTWQTHRGGPGRWRSVDVLTIDTSLVVTSSDSDLEHPVPQFYQYRPEYSVFGDHVAASAIWNLSDSVALVGEGVLDIDDSRVARGSVGVHLQHSPDLTTYVEFRYIDIDDTTLLGIGWNYQVTPKYRVSFSPQWDFRRDEFRSVRLQFTRTFPDFDLVIGVKRDEIKDDTKFTASINLHSF